MAEEKHSSEEKKAEKKEKLKDSSKKKIDILDSYDRILIDTFPASDSVAKY